MTAKTLDSLGGLRTLFDDIVRMMRQEVERFDDTHYPLRESLPSSCRATNIHRLEVPIER